MDLIFEPDDSGTMRATGYATVPYSSDVENEAVVETTEDDLAGIFDGAPVDELAGTGEPIQAAVDDPLLYRDFLVLEDEEIVFDEGYTRSDE